MRKHMGRVPRGGRLAAAIAAATILAVGISSVAGGAVGDNVRIGKRNAASGTTAIVGFTSGFATRQSNGNNGSGGAASYGCRAQAGDKPCLYVINHNNGEVFRFRSKGGVTAGRIDVVPPSGRTANDVAPFTTNANGVATGLNADEVDGQSADELKPLFAAVNADGTVARNRGLAQSGAVQRTGEGTYTVTFGSDVSACAYTATQTTTTDAGATGVAPVTGNANALQVVTRAGGGADGTQPTAPADRPFHLVVNC